MIRMMTACTNEIDDVQLALEALHSQLNLGETLRKHSAGILSCYSEFVDTGVVEALCQDLPFPVVGCTTLAGAAQGEMGTMMLTLTVLTSDEVSFATGQTDPIFDENPSVLHRGYQSVAAQQAEKPAFMIAFAPLLLNVGGDFFVSSLTEASDGVPVFGTIAVDHHSDYHTSSVIYNGKSSSNQMSMLLLYGPVEPRFFVASISDETLYHERGVVTAAEGNQLQTVNGVPVADYLSSLGLSKNEEGIIEGVNSFPFVVDYNDGTQPVVRVIFALTEEGFAVCGGNIPVGATLSVGSIDANQVLSTTEQALRQILAGEKANGVLLFSCIGRYFSLGYDSMAEMKKVLALPWEGLPYQLSYSGSELCPVYDQKGNTANRNHNDTLVACVF